MSHIQTKLRGSALALLIMQKTDAYLSQANRLAKWQDVEKSGAALSDAYPDIMMDADLGPGGRYHSFTLASPQAVLVGDNHPTNSGVRALYEGDAPIVFGITDWTKTGRGPVVEDLDRLVAMWAEAGVLNKLSASDVDTIVKPAIEAYFQELSRYAKSGHALPPYLTQEELQTLDPSSPILSMLQSAAKTDPDHAVKKFTGAPDGTKFLPKFALPSAQLRQSLAGAFQKYLQRLHGGLGQQIQVLDFGTETNVGGSNSGLAHYDVLARVVAPGKPARTRVFEIKQLTPTPTHYEGGNPALVDAKVSVHEGQVVTPHQDPFLGYLHLNGISYMVCPYDGREGSFDLKHLTPAQMQSAAKAQAIVTARVHEQSLSPHALRRWLHGLDVPAAMAKVLTFSEIYPQQLAQDCAAVPKLVSDAAGSKAEPPASPAAPT
jgi:hypothetical protein